MLLQGCTSTIDCTQYSSSSSSSSFESCASNSTRKSQPHETHSFGEPAHPPHFASCDPGGRPHAQPAAHVGEPPCVAHGAGSCAGAGGWWCF